MTVDLLKELSNGDSIASNEKEVRDILIRELKAYSDEISFDGLGSVIFHKKGNGPKVMFCAHMDEVGFMVRSISDIGMIYVIPIGGVKDEAKKLQKVRITTADDNKIIGILNSSIDDKTGKVKESYIDIGCDSKEEVENLGVDIGDMVCFHSSCENLNSEELIMGKAMDDRAGCYVLAEVLKAIENTHHDCDVYIVGTSSEEVGMRGGKTATEKIKPNIVFAVDVANAPELVRDHRNKRKIGHGPMLVHYDKAMIPNKNLLGLVKKLCKENNIEYQSDMFSGGGTDAGNAHLQGEGIPSMVIGIPLRLCHGPYSIVHTKDIKNTISLVVKIIENIDEEVYKNISEHIGGI
ncbi:aminopeptidase [Clostridium intestinale]|uniref:aminopeptidase n=1 Tax=Clostridium intestinale TaxID=36845 RepID=UPI002DD6973A|nr:aminopeptidase [Clostridium intestinale]WRY52128.1 aminopeptidase [Clostridium intestinale]